MTTPNSLASSSWRITFQGGSSLGGPFRGDLRLRGSAGGALTAKVDTGASRTVVPLAVLNGVRAPHVGEVVVAGYDGAPMRVVLREVTLVFEEAHWPPQRLSVLEGMYVTPTPDSEVLLGRDVLNKWVITLDGPEGVLGVE